MKVGKLSENRKGRLAMTAENPCETTPKHGVSDQADRTAHPPKSPTISTPDAGKTDRTEREPSEKVGNGLLPCPFCGGPADILIETGVVAVDCTVMCRYCSAEVCARSLGQTSFAVARATAIAAWNRRANGGSHD